MTTGLSWLVTVYLERAVKEQNHVLVLDVSDRSTSARNVSIVSGIESADLSPRVCKHCGERARYSR